VPDEPQHADGEQRAWDAAREGRPAVYLASDPPLSAGVLRELLTADEPPRVAWVVGARIAGQLDLEGLEIKCPVRLHRCRFESPLRLNAVTAVEILLTFCTVERIEGRRLVVRANLCLDGMRAELVDVRGADVGGAMTLRRASLINPARVALLADHLKVGQDLICSPGLRVRGTISMNQGELGGVLDLRGAQLVHSGGIALDAVGLKIAETLRGGPAPGRRLEVHGGIRLRGAEIGGHVLLHGADLTNPAGITLDLDSASIGQDVQCTHAAFTRADGEPNPDARFRFVSRGQVNLLAARIGGSLVFRGALIRRHGHVALAAGEIQVARHVACAPLPPEHPGGGLPFEVEGTFSLQGARIGGHLDLQAASLSRRGGVALLANEMRLDRSMTCTPPFAGRLVKRPFAVSGELTLQRAVIGGALDLRAATLDNPGAVALRGDFLQVGANLWLGSLEEPHPLAGRAFSANGEVRLPGMRVAGVLEMRGTVVHDDTAGGAAGRQPLAGTIDLRNASVAQLRDDPRRRGPYRLLLAGFRYASLDDGDSPRQARLRWIARARESAVPDAYDHLASIYRETGREEDARAVAVEKYRRERSRRKFFGRQANRLLGWTVGYGYRPGRGLACLVVLWLVSSLVFSYAAHSGQLHALKDSGLPQYRSWLYALDAVLPVVTFGQDAGWAPTGWTQYWYGFCVLAGWALITVLVGSLTRRLVRD
jgi:hypothetical protein